MFNHQPWRTCANGCYLKARQRFLIERLRRRASDAFEGLPTGPLKGPVRGPKGVFNG